MAKKIVIAVMAGVIALTAAGCATVKGVGRDISSVGQAGEDVVVRPRVSHIDHAVPLGRLPVGRESVEADQRGATRRLQMKQRFARDVCWVVETRPATTYDNFARDFGERFVSGYQRPSTVDLLMNSPFRE